MKRNPYGLKISLGYDTHTYPFFMQIRSDLTVIFICHLKCNHRSPVILFFGGKYFDAWNLIKSLIKLLGKCAVVLPNTFDSDRMDKIHTHSQTIEKGLILDDGGDLGVGDTFENGHLGYLEGITLYNTKDQKSVMAAGDLVMAGVEASIERPFGIPIAGYGSEMNAKFGPKCYNYHIVLSKIKKALDPNTASDPFFYAEPEKE